MNDEIESDRKSNDQYHLWLMKREGLLGSPMERDDDTEPEAVEIVSGECLVCKKLIHFPVDASENDRCCSKECSDAVDQWHREQQDAALKAMQKDGYYGALEDVDGDLDY